MLDIHADNIELRYLVGESLDDLSKAFGVHPEKIKQLLLSRNVPIRDRRSEVRRKIRKPLDTDEIVRRYVGGETMGEIAKGMGVSIGAIRPRLIASGTPIRDKDTAGRMRRLTTVDDAEVIRRYQAGESEKAIADSLGVGRPSIRLRLKEAGIPIRGRSESQLLRQQHLSPEDRLHFSEAAHAAVRGVPKSEEQLCKLAITREKKHANIGPSERTLAEWLRGLGIEITPQKAVGRYNVDVALTASRIAVDVFGGNWHSSDRHARRYRPRIEYLLDCGWHPVVVWVTTSHRLAYPVTEHIIALHEARRRGESFGRQEHVIRGDGYLVSVAQVKPHNGAIVLGFNPGNPNRGNDGCFR